MMRHTRLALPALAASCLLILGAAVATPGLAQQVPDSSAHPSPTQRDQPSPPKPYKPVSIKMPAAVDDSSFTEFRKKLLAAAKAKNLSALRGLVVDTGFFWLREDDAADAAETNKSPLDNLARAIGLKAADGSGWEILASFAEDDSAAELPGRGDVVCAPADPTYSTTDFENLLENTETDAYEWGFPFTDDVVIRSGPKPDAPVVAKLGLNLVRIYPDEKQPDSGPEADAVRVVAPSGKLGYVPIDAIAAFGNDQMCYQKRSDVWKIVGYIGAGNPQQ